MALGIFILANYMILLTLNIGRSFRKLSHYTLDMSRGIIPTPLDSPMGSEFGTVAANLNHHAAELQKKVGLLTSMSEEGPGEIYTPDMEDELGNALVMATVLAAACGGDVGTAGPLTQPPPDQPTTTVPTTVPGTDPSTATTQPSVTPPRDAVEQQFVELFFVKEGFASPVMCS